MENTLDLNTAVLNSSRIKRKPFFAVIFAISFAHMLNDMMQSMLLALYPMLKLGMHLSFAQIGLVTLTYQLTASLLQPLVGMYTDQHPKPYSLPMSMGFTMAGLLVLSQATTFSLLLCAAAMVGMGSSIFHPESSRVARIASNGQPGLTQSLFQVGGNMGSALGPLFAALLILPHGQNSVKWLSIAALLACAVLSQVSRWYKTHLTRSAGKIKTTARHTLSRKQVVLAMLVLGLLMFSKFFYTSSLSSYYTFYLIEKFHLALKEAQIYLFVFLFAVAAGTIAGGFIGDKIGRKRVIWASILGVAPFTLMLPHANLFWTAVLSVLIGLILSSAFSAILVFAQDLVPDKVGTISGLFFGLAFGMGGLGAALLGRLADERGITSVYEVCAYLPLIGLLAALLPDIEHKQ
ncbi:MAG TPA: MFS transporter [Burkholderiaceae bacterium]|jgi:FSR family fosmidomycin resistance protein-like MFS transporter